MATQVTVEVDTYRVPERVLNAGAGLAHALGAPFTRVSVDDVLRGAQRKTGLKDWGDERFIEVMRVLVDALNSAPITPLARVFCRQVLMKATVNRLRIERWFKEHPEANDIEVRKPIFVVGFPRTGTTVLQNLLSQPDSRRALQFWELTAPVPVYDDPQLDAKKRRAATNRMLSVAYFMAPEMGALHEVRADTPEECWGLFANTCAVLNYDFQSGLRAFGNHLFANDMTWAYAEYKRMLKMLLHQRPAEQLVLKCPEHLWFLDGLLNVFPDAGVVWTHRDPFDAVASYCSMMSMNRRVYYGRVELKKLGPYVMDRFHLGIERANAVRDARPDARIMDMRFVDLVQDQAAAVRRIHEHFDLEHPADMDDRVQAWLDARRADKRGKHLYDASRYGLDRDTVHARYADYIERYQVPLDQV